MVSINWRFYCVKKRFWTPFKGPVTNYEESILTIIFFVFVVFIFLAQKGLLDKGLGLQDQKLWIHQGNNKTKHVSLYKFYQKSVKITQNSKKFIFVLIYNHSSGEVFFQERDWILGCRIDGITPTILLRSNLILYLLFLRLYYIIFDIIK